VSWRAWPAAVITGASLAAACFVVGDHVVATDDGCLDSAGWFTATPTTWPAQDEATVVTKTAAVKTTVGRATEIGASGQTEYSDPEDNQIEGCLDVERIEIPAPPPAPDRQA